MTAAKILDPCCGSRMFWFDKGDQRDTGTVIVRCTDFKRQA